MGFKIRNQALEAVLQSEGFRHLSKAYLPARFSYPLAILTKELQGKMETIGEKQKEIVEKFCDRDENGNPKRRPDGGYFFKERMKEFEPEYKELMDQETSINTDKLGVDLDALNDALDKPLPALYQVELSAIIDFKFNTAPKSSKKKDK